MDVFSHQIKRGSNWRHQARLRTQGSSADQPDATQLQQSVKLLQMSALEFTREIEQALRDNHSWTKARRRHAAPTSRASATANANAAMNEALAARPGFCRPGHHRGAAGSGRPNCLSCRTVNRNTPATIPPRATGDRRQRRRAMGARSTEDLRDQACAASCPTTGLRARDRLMAEDIIEGLDEEGYLRTRTDGTRRRRRLRSATRTGRMGGRSEAGPPDGYPRSCARNLAECLKLQLVAMDEEVQRAIWQSISSNTKWNAWATRLLRPGPHMPMQRRCDAGSLRADPPARSASRTALCPGGFHLRRCPMSWCRNSIASGSLLPNRAAMPRRPPSPHYADLFRNARYSDRSPMAQELPGSAWLIRNVEQRYSYHPAGRGSHRAAPAAIRSKSMARIALRRSCCAKSPTKLKSMNPPYRGATSNKYMATPRGI